MQFIAGIVAMLAAAAAWGQEVQRAPQLSLRSAFDAAWARQPEATALDARRQAAQARKRIADSWAAEPPSLEASAKSDRFNGDNGVAEYEVGVVLPLWLAGERARSRALAEAEADALESRALASKLRVAGEVREAWWTLQRAALDLEVAQARLANARELSADVAKRVEAGDLARADSHQAEGVAAAAEASVAEAQGAASAAALRLRALTGVSSLVHYVRSEQVPVGSAGEHPALAELGSRAEAARRAADLAGVQTHANPEVLLATTRERGGFGNPYESTLTLGIRFPFGSGARNDAKTAAARGDAIEAETQLRVRRDALAADADLARARLDSVRAQLAAAERRERLAVEARGFVERSFRLGQSDLPTRLRVELEAYEAGRQAGRQRIELAAAVSALRQALGLLPE